MSELKKTVPWFLLTLTIFILLSFYFLYPGFNGLKTRAGLDQAQMAREISRGNFLVTKYIRPIAMWQVSKKTGKNIDLNNFPDTFNPPLNPILNGLVLKLTNDKWSFAPVKKREIRQTTKHVFDADYYIMVFSIFLFLCTLFLYFFLLKNIFDTLIAASTISLLTLTYIFWDQAQSGMAHSLTNLLFACLLFFIYRFINGRLEGNKTIFNIMIIGLLFGLLILSNYIMIFPFIGFFIYLIIKSDRGSDRIQNILVLTIFTILITGYFFYRNYNFTGNIFGSYIYHINIALNSGKERLVVGLINDSYDKIQDGFFRLIAINLQSQFNNLFKLYGLNIAIIASMISFLHIFNKKIIHSFRWCILGMWFAGVFGMAILGNKDGVKDLFQIHTAFIPIFTAYGIAFILILWKRLDILRGAVWFKVLPIFFVILLNFTPLLLTITSKFKVKMYYKIIYPLPKFYPRVSNLINIICQEREYIVSDIPQSTSWYGDVKSILLPRDEDNLESVIEYAESTKNRLIGIQITERTLSESMSDLLRSEEYKSLKVYLSYMINKNTSSLRARRYSTPLAIGFNNYIFLDSPTRSKWLFE